MGLSRKQALKRMLGTLPRIAAEPASEALSHWIHETRGWIDQIEQLCAVVGDKTSEEWQTKITAWRLELGE